VAADTCGIAARESLHGGIAGMAPDPPASVAGQSNRHCGSIIRNASRYKLAHRAQRSAPQKGALVDQGRPR